MGGSFDWTPLLPSSLAAILYLNTLKGNFVYDDSRAILSNPDILQSTPWTDVWRNDFWGTPLSHSGSHKSFRPLTTLSFRWNYAYSPDPFVFHLTNILLHVITTWLFGRVARVIFSPALYAPPQNYSPPNYLPASQHMSNRNHAGRRVAVLISSLAFASHPIHTEAVAGIVGRADVGATALALTTFLAYVNHVKYRDRRRTQFMEVEDSDSRGLICMKGKHRTIGRKSVTMEATSCKRFLSPAQSLHLRSLGWLGVSILLAGAAMLSKEQGLTILLICATFDIIRSLIKIRNKRDGTVPWKMDCFWSIIALGASFVLLFCLRLRAMGGYSETPTFSKADNPTAHQPHFFTRLFTFLYLPVFNFQLLIFPRRLSYDWSMDAIPPITRLCDLRNLVSTVFYVLLARRIILSFLAVNTLSKGQHNWEGSPGSSGVKGLCPLCWINPLHRTNNNSLVSRPTVDSLYNYGHAFTFKANGVHGGNGVHSSRTTRSRSLAKSSPPPISTPPSPSLHGALLLQLAFLVVPFLPATNLFFYVGFVVAERVAYMPSVGFCLLLGHGILHFWSQTNPTTTSEQRLGPRSKLLISACATVCLIVFCLQTVLRNEDWSTEERLYRAGIQINPPKSWGNLGHVLSRAGRRAEAEVAYRQALTFRSNMADVHYNLGLLVEGEGRLEEALLCYRSAIHFRPLLAPAYVSLGHVLLAMGRRTEAMQVFERCFQLEDEGVKDLRTHSEAKVTALLCFGRLLVEVEDASRAINIYKQALDLMPPNYSEAQSVYNAMGEALFRSGATSEGEQWLQKALRQKPDHIPAYLTYGKMLARNKTRLLEAETWFRRAKKLAPGDSSVYHHYGQFLSMQGRHWEASEALVTAASLSPSEYDIIVGAANALRQVGENKRAEGYYEMAVALKPKESRAHMNLGAILHINGKYREAEGSYLMALELKPADDVTLLNLQKLRQLQSKANQSYSVGCRHDQRQAAGPRDSQKPRQQTQP